MAGATTPFDFEIATPPGWIHVPVGADNDGQIDQWMERLGKLAGANVPPLVDSFARLALERLCDEDAEFGSYYLDLFQHDDPNEPPYLVLALLTLIPGRLDGEACPSLDQLAAQLRSTYGSSLLSVREILTEDGRQCLSTSMINTTTLGDGDQRIESRAVDMRVYVPAPEFDQIITLLCVTPNIELETELRELFETIAATLRLEPAEESELSQG